MLGYSRRQINDLVPLMCRGVTFLRFKIFTEILENERIWKGGIISMNWGGCWVMSDRHRGLNFVR